MRLDHAAALAGLVCLLLLAGWIGWALARHHYEPVSIAEKPAAPVWHDDGSLTAIRAPNATPDLPAPSAPAGGVLIRTVEVTVMAKPEIVPSDNPAQAGDYSPEAGDYSCPPVTVRLDMHQYDDGVRVSVQSDGEVLDAVDIPRSVIFVHDVKQNVVGFDVSGDRKTIRYGRAIGSVDVGVQLSEESGDLTHGAWMAVRF